MWKRHKGAADGVNAGLTNVIDEMKKGAIKGAAAGSLGALASKGSDAAKSSQLKQKAQRLQREASKRTSVVTDRARKETKNSLDNADLDGKTSAVTSLLHELGNRVGEKAKSTQKSVNGPMMTLDADDLPRLIRGATLLAKGFGTLFAPGSALDATSDRSLDPKRLSQGTKRGIDTAADLTQARIKDGVDAAKDALSSLSDALTNSIEGAEEHVHRALDETEKTLTHKTSRAAKQAKNALPTTKRGGTGKWLFFGILVGGVAAFLSSPLSGALGDRVATLRRDLGLGGDDEDDSQYWPSPPNGASANGASQPTVNSSSPDKEEGTTGPDSVHDS